MLTVEGKHVKYIQINCTSYCASKLELYFMRWTCTTKYWHLLYDSIQCPRHRISHVPGHHSPDDRRIWVLINLFCHQLASPIISYLDTSIMPVDKEWIQWNKFCSRDDVLIAPTLCTRFCYETLNSLNCWLFQGSCLHILPRKCFINYCVT